MKKYKVVSTILFLIISLSLFACFCAGCDFIQYVEKSDNNQVISDEVKRLQEEYVDKLYNVTSQIEYRENEQKLYEYAVQDAVNELYECRSEEDLKQVYEKHLVIIGKIKTDKEYSDEEEANAISAYRVAILGQAEESYDKQKYTEMQITYFDTVFAAFSGALFETNIREEMNELLQKFYFDVHKEDVILSLNSYADISIYEDSQKSILTDTLDKCTEDIRSCVNKEDIDEIKDIYVFEVYKRNTVKKLNDYIDLKLYRDEQVAQIKSILKEHLELAEEAETNIEEDNVFREYQIAVYNIPTDEMLYSDELEDLKKQLNSTLVNSYKISFYRENDGLTVQELLKSFQDLLETIKRKEDVLSQYVLFKNRLDSVKTSKALDEEDRINLIEELYDQIKGEIDKNIETADKGTYLAKAEEVYLAMKDRVSLEGIRQECSVFIQEIAGATIGYVRNELIEFNSAIYYRENEKNYINALKEEYLAKFTDDIEIESAKALLQEAKNAISEVKTNDDLWNDSLSEFRTTLNALYGDAILEEPRSLTEANDYYELANIIDYYAFYQLSYTEFIEGKFRIYLNYLHNDAQYEINEVYWYCELLRSAVGITGYLENNDYLVFELVPYAIATKNNRYYIPLAEKNENAVEFNFDGSEMQYRDIDFDNFAYKNYKKQIRGIWNTQQLWYALEHEYVPICEVGSIAERTLNKAKSILCEIIMEGMSNEEKIFQIYTWFGQNVSYDTYYSAYLGSSDMDHFPDEQASTLDSFHVEGALLRGLAVCEGYAKAYLLLLRLEGIESYRVFVRSPMLMGINTLNTRKIMGAGYGSHAYVAIRQKSGLFLCSDAETSSIIGTPKMQSYHQLMVNSKMLTEYFGGFTYMYSDMEFESEISDIYRKLYYKGCSLYIENKQQAETIINSFKNNAESDIQISLFCDLNIYNGLKDDLIDFDYIEKSASDGRSTLKEFIIYN